MDILYAFASIVFFISLTRALLFWLYLLQESDFSLKRILKYLFFTTKGNDALFSVTSILKVISICTYVVSVFDERFLFSFSLFVSAIFTLGAIKFVKDIITNSLHLPHFSFRILYIMFPTLLIAVVFYHNPLLDHYLWLLLLDFLLLVIISVLLFSLSFPTEIYRDIIVQKAQRKLRELHEMKRIVVIGDYAKNITIELIRQVLSTKFFVSKIHSSIYTDFYIARGIVDSVNPESNILITAIDDYEKEEGVAVATLLHPDIFVTTALNERQHPHVYPTVYDNIIALLHQMNKKHVALLHDTKGTWMKRLQKEKRKKHASNTTYQIYSSTQEKHDTGVIVKETKLKKDGTVLRIQFQNKDLLVHSSLLGNVYADALLPSIFIAKMFGYTNAEIKNIVSRFTPLDHCMVPYQMNNGSILLDNTYASHKRTLMDALGYMKLFKGKKIMIFTPMIEKYPQVHKDIQEIATAIAVTCDYLFLVDKHFHKDIIKGFYEAGGGCIIKYGNTYTISSFIKKNIHSKDDIVACVGNDTVHVVRRIQKKMSS